MATWALTALKPHGHLDTCGIWTLWHFKHVGMRHLRHLRVLDLVDSLQVLLVNKLIPSTCNIFDSFDINFYPMLIYIFRKLGKFCWFSRALLLLVKFFYKKEAEPTFACGKAETIVLMSNLSDLHSLKVKTVIKGLNISSGSLFFDRISRKAVDILHKNESVFHMHFYKNKTSRGKHLSDVQYLQCYTQNNYFLKLSNGRTSFPENSVTSDNIH